MDTKGVLFDLFGTLVASLSVRALERAAGAMGKELGVAPDAFARTWVESFPRRAVDTASSVEETIEQVCRGLGRAPVSAGRDAAAAIWLDYIRKSLAPRDGVVEVLSRLKKAGLRTGLISDCSVEVPMLWSDTLLAPWFDAAVFSCREGLKKPHPAVFLSICRRLELRPDECLYVADGSNCELHAASKLGMRGVLIRLPDEDPADTFRAHPEAWDGPTVTHPREILPLVGLAQSANSTDLPKRT